MDKYLETFCFDEKSDFDISFNENYIPGDFRSRIKRLAEYIAQDGKMITLYEGLTESYTSTVVDIDDFLVFGVGFCIAASLLLVVVLISTSIFMKGIQ